MEGSLFPEVRIYLVDFTWSIERCDSASEKAIGKLLLGVKRGLSDR